MSRNKGIDLTVRTLAILGILVLVNVLGVSLWGRLDLTRDHEFTLSQATRKTLSGLDDPVTVTAYFTRDLPPPFSENARYVKDLLGEYYAHSGGHLRYRFVDPESEETAADQKARKEVRRDIFGRAVRQETSVEKKLQGLGVVPVQVTVDKDDKATTRRAYMGLVVRYHDRTQAVPVVKNTNGLEYELTTLIRKVTRKHPPKIAFLTGHGGPDLQKDMSDLDRSLGQLYDVEPLNLAQKKQIPADVKALLVVGPQTPLSPPEKHAIDQFVMAGHPAAFLLGEVAPDLQHMQARPIHPGVKDLLSKWGVSLQPGLVLDARCASVNVTRQQGFMRIQEPVRYPFIPVDKSLASRSPITRGLTNVSFPFVSPVDVTLPKGSKVKAVTLARSSAKSWLATPPYDLDPLQQWTASSLKDQGSKPLMVALRGPLNSAYVADPPGKTASSAGIAQAKDARVLVAGSYAFALDRFQNRGDQALAMNLMDWLMKDDSLLAVRARGMDAAPLDDISSGERSALKYGNLLGLPILVVLFGVVRWRLREARRRTAKV